MPLPLGFNTLCKPNLSCYCDASNCLSFSVNIGTIEVLACDGVDEHVQSLLERLQKLNNGKKKNKGKKVTEESKNNTPCNDDEEVEPVNYRVLLLEQALQKFQSQ
ncbi:hypothetical protein C2G38_2183473 [Gigaspora rosea]|uniref:Uncharacterized protein n=1 Tax=Gigaspora rosea TaxID=44941 RepID=A0A397VD44_9GLOM|nr:hypothetical protein C2G38_2183473 [Gigaspora rosea]